jgi:hypothetical protein
MVTKVKIASFDTADNLGFADIVNYGARSDGITDCTAAITAAQATGLPVFIPAGTFLCSAFTLGTGNSLFGVGRKSILKQIVAGNSIFITLSSNTTVADLVIDGNKTNQTGTNLHGLRIASITDVALNNITVKDTKGDAINISGTGTSGVSLVETTVTGYTASGFAVRSGNNISFTDCDAVVSDVVASPGDGFSIASDGNEINTVTLTACNSVSNVGRGFALVGNGTKNVIDVIANGCIAKANSLHGFNAILTERVTYSSCNAKSNLQDGFRLEGDVQNSRLTTCTANGNSTFGFREVISGSTPNLNYFIYSLSTNNGTNTVTKVGAGSVIV